MGVVNDFSFRKAQQPKWTVGDVVYNTIPIQVTGGASRIDTHDVGEQASIRQHNPPTGHNQEQWQIEFSNGAQVWVGEEYLTTKKPKFEPDDIVVENGDPDQWRIAEIAEYEDFGQGPDWYYVLIDVNSKSIDDTNIHNKKESELSFANQQQQADEQQAEAPSTPQKNPRILEP